MQDEQMLVEAEDYYWIMAARQRLITVDEGRTALCTFFVLDSELEIHTFYDRRCWTTPADHEDGSVLYIDKLLATHFTRPLFRLMEQVLTERFPLWETIVWYRPRQLADQRYTYLRRAHGTVLHG